MRTTAVLLIMGTVAAALALAVRKATAQTIGDATGQAAQPFHDEAGSQEKCIVEGIVVDAATSQTLKRVAVTLQRTDAPPLSAVAPSTGNILGSSGQRQTRTDGTGHFIFPDVDPGQYSLSANRPGFLPKEYGQDSPDGPAKALVLRPGDRKDGLVFRLTPTGVITGHVFDEDGEPLGGATVQALEWHYINGHRQLQQVGGSNTNDLGEYRLTGLRAQKYYVSATYNDWNQGVAQDGPSQTYVSSYYPGTPDPSTAQPVEVQPGQESSSMDITLEPIPAVRVTGRLTGHTLANNAGIGFNVSLARPEAGTYFYQQARIDPNGWSFEVDDVPPGSYVLNAQIWDHGLNYFGRQKIDVGNSNLDGLSVTVGLGAKIHGFVHAEGRLDLNLKGMQVTLTSRDLMQPGAQPAAVAADGSFTLTQVPDGPYDVQICCLPPQDYLKSARMGSEDGLENGLNISQTDPPGVLDLMVSGTAGEAEGVVKYDGKPAGNATVVLVPDPARRERIWLYKVVNSGPDGRFSFQGIAPGNYELFAWQKVEYGAYQDSDFLLPLEDKATPIRVNGGSNLNVEVQVIPDQPE